MRPVQQSLLEVLLRIVATGAVCASDEHALAGAYRGTGLTVGQSREIYAALLSETWGDVIDDDALSASQCASLAMIAEALGLPTRFLPRREQLAVAV